MRHRVRNYIRGVFKDLRRTCTFEILDKKMAQGRKANIETCVDVGFGREKGVKSRCLSGSSS
jgi:hypothetical protein